MVNPWPKWQIAFHSKFNIVTVEASTGKHSHHYLSAISMTDDWIFGTSCVYRELKNDISSRLKSSRQVLFAKARLQQAGPPDLLVELHI